MTVLQKWEEVIDRKYMISEKEKETLLWTCLAMVVWKNAQ